MCEENLKESDKKKRHSISEGMSTNTDEREEEPFDSYPNKQHQLISAADLALSFKH